MYDDAASIAYSNGLFNFLDGVSWFLDYVLLDQAFDF